VTADDAEDADKRRLVAYLRTLRHLRSPVLH
jgi:hypothetical protein